jgi:hypothetical protein
MADYSLGYGGIGTGLDITGMVKQLVAADRAPADASLNRIESVPSSSCRRWERSSPPSTHWKAR